MLRLTNTARSFEDEEKKAYVDNLVKDFLNPLGMLLKLMVVAILLVTLITLICLLLPPAQVDPLTATVDILKAIAVSLFRIFVVLALFIPTVAAIALVVWLLKEGKVS